MARQFLVFLGASVAGFIVLGLVESISWMLYPAPEDLDLTDMEALAAYAAQVPLTAKLIVLAAWMIGAFVAGFIAGKFAPEGTGPKLALMAGGVLMLGGIMNTFMVPHPVWMLVIGLLQYLPMAYLGAKTAGAR